MYEQNKTQSSQQLSQLLQRLDTLKGEKEKIVKKHEELMNKIADAQDAGKDP